jgi:hypothetical protein
MNADKSLTEGSQPVDRNAAGYVSDSNSETSKEQDLLAHHGHDPALSRKMALVNDAINELGWTPYHSILFCLNGFG